MSEILDALQARLREAEAQRDALAPEREQERALFDQQIRLMRKQIRAVAPRALREVPIGITVLLPKAQVAKLDALIERLTARDGRAYKRGVVLRAVIARGFAVLESEGK